MVTAQDRLLFLNEKEIGMSRDFVTSRTWKEKDWGYLRADKTQALPWDERKLNWGYAMMGDSQKCLCSSFNKVHLAGAKPVACNCLKMDGLCYKWESGEVSNIFEKDFPDSTLELTGWLIAYCSGLWRDGQCPWQERLQSLLLMWGLHWG